jgi:hypothetical protein
VSSQSRRDEAWRTYEREVALLFEQLELNARIQDRIVGARATHKVDVAVRHSRSGVEQLWIVECKQWKSSVKKEIIAALATIVEDVGADRGFVFCESGFQRGARDAARHTNITLTSIAQFRHGTRDQLIEVQLRQLARRVRTARDQLWALWKIDRRDDGMHSAHIRVGRVDGVEAIATQGKLSIIESILDHVRSAREEAAEPRYYVPDPRQDWRYIRVASWEQFWAMISNLVDMLSRDVALLVESNSQAMARDTHERRL